MARTDHSEQTFRTARRSLRREVPSTVGLLADERDFTAMRRYRTFTFDDHATYLRQIDGLLKSLASQGLHTTVALFDPEEYAEYCADSGLDPDTADSRGRFTARIPGSGAAIAYTGQPIDSLVPQLISTAVRRATWEYATTLLADLGECADCGQDIGRAAFDRASHLLLRLLEGAGSGTHHLVCSVPAADEQLLAVLRTEDAGSPDNDPDGLDGPDGVSARLDSSQATEFVTVLAVGIALESAGGVVLRTARAGDPDRLHGWRLQHGSLVPLTVGEVFSAYCTDADTGDPVSPESGVEYCAGFDLGPDDTGTHH
ncbi:hypothetical protein [Streptomyces scopuliridis]|uniref:Uncharacterized protein n=1 Tax=Streptomyces scopuliridis RB72 TaxID=1440053 RepID=A0A2T7TBU3_9ACTN|nr:hypothetical protein [Streptomyces scopuliridis]PVE12561.1 hypothetical protein Y717_32110 [Streptomyces scopuliridis RB72]